MGQLTEENNLLWRIKDLTRSFEVSLLEIYNKLFRDYNYGVVIERGNYEIFTERKMSLLQRIQKRMNLIK